MFSTKVDHLVLNQTPILFLFNVPKEFILRQQHILSIWSTKNKYEQYVHVKKVPKKEIVISLMKSTLTRKSIKTTDHSNLF